MARPAVVAEIIRSRPQQKIIVCSAPGKSEKYDHKVTDHLLKLGGQVKDRAEIDYAISRFKEITEDLDKDFQANLLSGLRKDLTNSNDVNFIVSRGEYYSALALAQRVDAEFIDAAEIFYFDGDGKLDREKTAEKIRSRLKTGQTIVTPGFYGVNGMGEICLFKRGGSDRSGAVIAASLNWDYENWTDIDGIMNADPNIIPEAKTISELTYEEVREGAHGGTGTLMGDSILDLEYGEFNTILKNTFNPQAAGTIIKRSRQASETRPVVAISARSDLLGLTVHDMGMRDRRGYLARVMEILAENRLSIEHMPAAQDAITITFHNKPGLNTEIIKHRVAEILVSPSAGCSISRRGVVYLVGEHLRELTRQHRVVIDTLQTLENNNIPVLAVIMHPDSPSVAVILRHDQTTDAQKILYHKFLSAR
ncbi:hypothetical protein KY385_04005 [Candidatus Parcubacteria bacterium]|nr:hypothetical protein [Candidatus Parcubacteria bacterium]